MAAIDTALLFISCLIVGSPAHVLCDDAPMGHVASVTVGPVRAMDALDVELTAMSALVWDEASGAILYEKNAHVRRPIASLSKLLSALVVRERLSATALIEIPPAVVAVQRQGVDVKLPVGEHVVVSDLLSAGLIASANDAFVALAVAAEDTEEAFAEYATLYAERHGFVNTRVHNATGLAGGEQYSTAYDVKDIFRAVVRDPLLAPYTRSSRGVLRTTEGSVREYTTTNKLLGTYVPVIAGKTGYTTDAQENLVIMTEGDRGQKIGVIVLGSAARFHDTKVLTEWIWRNYTWE